MYHQKNIRHIYQQVSGWVKMKIDLAFFSPLSVHSCVFYVRKSLSLDHFSSKYVHAEVPTMDFGRGQLRGEKTTFYFLAEGNTVSKRKSITFGPEKIVIASKADLMYLQ